MVVQLPVIFTPCASFHLRLLYKDMPASDCGWPRTPRRDRLQTLDLKPRDLVEFDRDSQSKDVTGWRGPGQVVSRDRADEGIIELRWQSGLYQCRMPDVRRAIAYSVVLASFYRRDYPGESPWQIVVMMVEQLNPQTSVLFGMEIGNDGR